MVHVSRDALVKAFWASLPPDSEAFTLQHYFNRDQWTAAVMADDMNLYQPDCTSTAVMLAASMPEKLQNQPKLRPLVDRCAALLQGEDAAERK